MMALMTLLDRFRLDDKVATVTGASRGIGAASAAALAEVTAQIEGHEHVVSSLP